MKVLFIILTLFISFSAHGQNELSTRTVFTNHHPAHSWRDKVYLLFEMAADFKPCKIKVINNTNGTSSIDTLHKINLYHNKKLNLNSYYYDLGKAKDIYSRHLISVSLLDSIGNTIVTESITEKDQKDIAKAYGVSAPGASQKDKLKTFQKTGNTQGELMGKNEDIRIVKRETCVDKKKRYRKNGVNGNKEMTTGF